MKRADKLGFELDLQCLPVAFLLVLPNNFKIVRDTLNELTYFTLFFSVVSYNLTILS